MPLNPAQKAATEYLEGPLLVLAGPGTGKTQLLSSKVEYILKNTDANPENILCLTYTESGAMNMRTRLFSIIGPAASRINIHTYHAFGSDILMSYKNYAETFSRKLDAPIDTITQHKIVREIQTSLPANDIMRSDKIADIIETIGNAKNARLTADDLQKIAEDNLAVSADIMSDLSQCFDNLVPRMKFEAAVAEVYLPLLEIFTKYFRKTPITKNISREINTYIFELNKIIEDERAKEKPSIRPLSKWKDQRFEKDEKGNYRLKNLIANKKLLSLSNIMRAYDAHLEKNGLFDFSDMIEEAINALKTDAGFRLTLSERYQYILLDEFQDTNPSQAELIYLLTDYEKPNVMAVGDDDQAIFAFQGANASNLLEFQEHYSANLITLTENYRSSSNILDFSHKIADQIETSFAKNHDTPKILTAMRKFSQTEISRDEFISADAEYYWVAEKISELVKSGVKQSEIAVITPKHKYVAPLLPYLKNHKHINIAYEKRDNLFEDPEISRILKLSRFIYELSEGKNPTHRLLEILSFPFWQIDPLTVIKTCTNLPKKDQKSALGLLENSEDKSLNDVAKFLADMVQLSYDAPLEIFINKLLERILDDPDAKHFELYENLAVLREALKSYLQVEKPTLTHLIAFIDDYESADQPLTNTSPYQDSENSVQILTAHKSKGLEFEYVFLVAADNIAWGKGKGNNNFLTLPANLIQIRHTGITDDERLRLFFVAITRAKSHLFITNSVKDFSGKSPARLDYLAEYEDENGDIISPYLDNLKVNQHYTDLDVTKKATDLRLNWAAGYQKLTPELKPILRSRVENYRLSASDLTSFIDIIYAGPREFYNNKLLRFPPEPASKEIILGNLIHSAFEKVTNAHISDQDALKTFESEASLAPLQKADLNFILDRGKSALKTSLETFADILRYDNARAEVNLAHEHLFLDQVPILGIIDHININDTEKTIEVYDFKTGNYKDKSWDSDTTLYKYKLQLGFYKLLLNLSPTYQKYQVKKAHILFVTPDQKTGEVHDKIYEYNEKDETELRSLIRSVYAQISSLDFLDNPEIFIEKDETRRLSDLKAFVDLLLQFSEK